MKKRYSRLRLGVRRAIVCSNQSIFFVYRFDFDEETLLVTSWTWVTLCFDDTLPSSFLRHQDNGSSSYQLLLPLSREVKKSGQGRRLQRDRTTCARNSGCVCMERCGHHAADTRIAWPVRDWTSAGRCARYGASTTSRQPVAPTPPQAQGHRSNTIHTTSDGCRQIDQQNANELINLDCGMSIGHPPTVAHATTMHVRTT